MKTIKVNSETHKQLNKLKGRLMIKEGVTYSYDDVITELLNIEGAKNEKRNHTKHDRRNKSKVSRNRSSK